MRIIASFFAIIMLASSLVGCVATYNPIPKNYQGNTAKLDDTYKVGSTSSGQFFYLSKVDGKQVNNSIRATHQASYGQGMLLTPVGFSREVPTEPMTLTLVAQVHHAAPINYMFNAGSNFIVSGDVSFTPEANQHYVVKGYLSPDFSSVWIENMSGKQVSDAIVLEGDPDESKTKIAMLSDGEVKLPEPEKNQAAPKKSILITNQPFDNPLFFLERGLSVDAVVTKLGKPDHIRVIEKGFFNNSPEIQLYHYKDIGAVEMVKSQTDQQFYSRRTHNVSSQEHYQFIDVVNQADGIDTQRIGRKYDRIGVYDEQYLDALASKLWLNKQTTDGNMLDGIAYYCKIFANAQTARYQSLLKSIIDNKDVPSKLRRHCKNAKKEIEKLKLTQVEQFQFL
ncbi:hypothetical protein IT970_11220 [Pseudoalteromonas sp. A41-2]|uniref:hypothetical protein n=1 Tax=Pseudoalteromonas sp. A41-2 TaxID=2785910 RepID=UPI0018CAC343|nr:hypothetical protein [Pseudoalteromonas sp. A41-2]QPL42041.1 hypothetical protein IT970_11220 [Pseudoalteromonas sp. A41-2]